LLFVGIRHDGGGSGGGSEDGGGPPLAPAAMPEPTAMTAVATGVTAAVALASELPAKRQSVWKTGTSIHLRPYVAHAKRSLYQMTLVQVPTPSFKCKHV